MGDEAKIKGLYIQSALDVLAEMGGEEHARRIADQSGVAPDIRPLREYPMKWLSRVVDLAQKQHWPSESYDDVAVRFGRKAFHAFASSLVGKVGLTLIGEGSTAQKLGDSMVSMFNASSSAGKATLVSASATTFRMRIVGAVNPYWQLGLFLVPIADSGLGKAQLIVNRYLQDEEGVPDADFEVDVVLNVA